MRAYETVILLDAKFDNDTLDAELKKFSDFLTTAGATSIQMKKWGRKEIAYSLSGHDWAHYASFDYKSEKGSIVAEVSSILRINDAVIKFETHKLESSESAQA